MDQAQPLRITVAGREARGLRLAGAPEVGLPVALVHGIACSSEVFTPLLARLATRTFRREVVALDMPGYGHTPGARGALDIEELARWYADALAVLGLGRVHVVGHSLGCQVALALARMAPERVGSATLIGPTTGAEGQGLARYAAGLVADSLFESWAYNLTLLRMARQMGVRRYVRTVPCMLRDRPLTRAAEVRCPVLIVRGTRDRIVPARVVRRLAAALPDGRVAHVPGVAHAVQFDQPEAFIAALLPFLSGAEVAEAATVDPELR